MPVVGYSYSRKEEHHRREKNGRNPDSHLIGKIDPKRPRLKWWEMQKVRQSRTHSRGRGLSLALLGHQGEMEGNHVVILRRKGSKGGAIAVLQEKRGRGKIRGAIRTKKTNNRKSRKKRRMYRRSDASWLVPKKDVPLPAIEK